MKFSESFIFFEECFPNALYSLVSVVAGSYLETVQREVGSSSDIHSSYVWSVVLIYRSGEDFADRTAGAEASFLCSSSSNCGYSHFTFFKDTVVSPAGLAETQSSRGAVPGLLIMSLNMLAGGVTFVAP